MSGGGRKAASIEGDAGPDECHEFLSGSPITKLPETILLEREWLLRDVAVLDRRSTAEGGPGGGGEAACGRLVASEGGLLLRFCAAKGC